MRRSDREVTGFNDIVDILNRADTIRIGLHNTPYPYVVPVSFGFEAADGKIEIYFHGAKVGLKHDLIANNPNVCVEADIFHNYAEVSDGLTVVYESFIGFGIAELVCGGEAAKGIDFLLLHCGYTGFAYDHSELDVTAVYRITLESFTGKRRFIDH